MSIFNFLAVCLYRDSVLAAAVCIPARISRPDEFVYPRMYAAALFGCEAIGVCDLQGGAISGKQRCRSEIASKFQAPRTAPNAQMLNMYSPVHVAKRT